MKEKHSRQIGDNGFKLWRSLDEFISEFIKIKKEISLILFNNKILKFSHFFVYLIFPVLLKLISNPVY